MLFSSLEFLFLFLPAALGLYALSPRRWKNGILLLESLVFYAWGEPILVFLMLAVALLHYGAALWMERTRRRKRLLWSVVAADLALLVYFKYTDFLRGLVGLHPLGVVLPLGISFYLFQAMSYVVDVYRRDTEACGSFVRFGAYLTFFPQLVAGPIVRYPDMRDALARRRETLPGVAHGFARFCAGLCKKVLLANGAGAVWETMRELTLRYGSPVTAWVGLLCFGLQIYYDFSGYSDMAVGLGGMFGFSLPQNFNYPYVARSVREFWKRWHITLSSWFREYVYIPLGGSRCSRGRALWNLLVTWSLTGLWHGASLNFLLWGLFFFLLLAGERLVWGGLLARAPRLLQHGYLLFCVGMGWLLFAFDGSEATLTAASGIQFFGSLFAFSEIGKINGEIRYEVLRQAIPIILMIIGATPIVKTVLDRIKYQKTAAYSAAVLTLSLLGIVVSVSFLTVESYNPFLYFRF